MKSKSAGLSADGVGCCLAALFELHSRLKNPNRGDAMIKQILIFLAVALASIDILAQATAPELAPLAAKYEADIKALDAARVEALSRAQQQYLDALTATEKTSGLSGNLAAVAAIHKDRDSLNKGE